MPSWDIRFDLRVDVDDPAMVHLVTRADAMVQFIRALPLPPSARERLDRLNIARAVRGTTGIEGSLLTQDQVEAVLNPQIDRLALADARERDADEARNAATVMRFVAETLEVDRTTPITESLIRRIHELITEGIPYEENEPGEYRRHRVSAGEYLAPPYEKVGALMQEFVRWLNEPPASAWPLVVRALAAHFYFVSIHPFVDGNGRTARALESFVLYQAGLSVLGFYSLANFYYEQRGRYQDELDRVRFRSDGNLTSFVRFGAEGLVQEMQAVYEEALIAARLYAFRDYARGRIRSSSLRTGVRERLMNFLFELDGDNVVETNIYTGRHRMAATYVGKSVRMIRRDVDQLVRFGLLVREHGTVRANVELMDQYQRVSPP